MDLVFYWILNNLLSGKEMNIIKILGQVHIIILMARKEAILNISCVKLVCIERSHPKQMVTMLSAVKVLQLAKPTSEDGNKYFLHKHIPTCIEG